MQIWHVHQTLPVDVFVVVLQEHGGGWSHKAPGRTIWEGLGQIEVHWDIVLRPSEEYWYRAGELEKF